MTNLPFNPLYRRCVIAALAFSGLLVGLPAAGAAYLYLSPTYYAEMKTSTCGTNNTCAVTFRKVATGKTLMINHISCRIVAKSTTAPLTRAVLLDNVGQIRESLTPALLSTDGENVQYFQSSNAANTVFTAATNPQVAVTFDGSIPIQELTCDIGGQFLPSS